MTLLVIHEISQTLGPVILELHQDFNQLNIVFQLRINYFDILFILLMEVSEVLATHKGLKGARGLLLIDEN